ncbi:transcription factor bHLH19-like [Hibiscus syriacus]|uniref:Epidermal patterning factor-like protein n=1 Tax=Hibiscus syriacus TaxID=106335 RepID=A0A6A2XEZ5_HIBSY|nr:EPIDERMAL PATTERNING FACTOR-like protein 2 [Hibiscus syriacus]KAE8665755.1 transcription factor bHLH19-like [Hibiscus syriacus]
MILTTTHVSYKAEGKPNLTSANSFSKTINEEKATLLRGQIGSRPPRCEGRCSSCGHCEAIQVPANPQVQHGNDHSSTSNSDVSFARKGGGGNSNYKPLSWKCKCGNFIFNP